MKSLALGCAALVLVLLLAAGEWWYWLELDPRIAIPSPPVPSPNAYDEYVAVTASLVSPGTIPDVLEPAATRPRGTSSPSQMLAVNGGALRRLRAAFALDCLHPPVRSFATDPVQFSGFRSLAYLLQLDAHQRAAGGDHDGALHSSLDGIHFGEDLTRGGPMMALINSVAVESICRPGAWDNAERLTATQSRRAARRLEAIMQRGASYDAVLQEEEWTILAGLLETFRERDWRNGLVLPEGAGPSGSVDWQGWRDRLRALCVSKTAVVRDYRRYMAHVIQEARKPYGQRASAPQVDKPWVELFAPAEAGWARDGAQTYNALLLGTLALRAHRLERGTYPASLQELVPTYLRRVPVDPFGAGPLKYRRAKTGCVLYSVGPDAKDDGGAPISVSRTSRRGLTRLRPGTTGDVVAGINRG